MVIYLYLMNKKTFQSAFPKNCGTPTFCPWPGLLNGGREKLLNVDSNYLLIWLIASGLCSNYMLGKTGIKRVNFGPGINKLMSEECERDGSPIHLQIELIVCFLFLLLLLCCAPRLGLVCVDFKYGCLPCVSLSLSCVSLLITTLRRLTK